MKIWDAKLKDLTPSGLVASFRIREIFYLLKNLIDVFNIVGLSNDKGKLSEN
jgi:hypothetical protein